MQLHSTSTTETRPEAMGDVPGICELPLTRAVVQYRDLHEMDAAGGRIEDIGLALVVEGRYASTAEVVDLGSGSVKVLDLSTELVVLDWVYDPTVDHVAELITASAATQQSDDLKVYSRKLGLRVLERVGFAGDLFAWLAGGRGTGTAGWFLALLPLSLLGLSLAMGRLVTPLVRSRSVAWDTRRSSRIDLARFLAGTLLAAGIAWAAHAA